MKRLIWFLVTIVTGNLLYAQQFNVTAGTDFSIAAGSVITVEGLSLTPEAAVNLNGVTISKNNSVTNPIGGTALSRSYLFEGTALTYSGPITVAYENNDLNGLTEDALRVFIFNGTSWQTVATSSIDTVGNILVSDALSSITIKEITVAAYSGSLPVQWLGFTAVKQQENVVLHWSTAAEINALEYTVEHSMDGVSWEVIGALPAGLNSSAIRKYQFKHLRPVPGTHYYRIRESDLDGRNNYTVVRQVIITAVNAEFTIYENPVCNGVLTLNVTKPCLIRLFDISGRMLGEHRVNAGMLQLPVQKYIPGVYLIRSSLTTQRFVIQ